MTRIDKRLHWHTPFNTMKDTQNSECIHTSRPDLAMFRPFGIVPTLIKAIFSTMNEWMNEWKCEDFKCVWKLTESRLCLTHYVNKPSRWAKQSRKWSGSPWSQSDTMCCVLLAVCCITTNFTPDMCNSRPCERGEKTLKNVIFNKFSVVFSTPNFAPCMHQYIKLPLRYEKTQNPLPLSNRNAGLCS